LRGSLASDTQGAALIEAALVLPVLLVVVFGMADLALFLWQTNSAHKAVQLGARQAIVSPSVAVGAGLTSAESQTYWFGLPLGDRCAPAANGRSICPVFTVTCSVTAGCVCDGPSCKFTFSETRLSPILEAMRAALPRLRPEQVEISYSTNYLGYVGQPVPVPVDVSVRITNLRYDLMFLGDKLGPSIPITASAVFPSEHMRPMDIE
jgi:hypothetical protein